MSNSYYRECKFCGRRIQMRQMPGGQWVAFEGYDTVHDCKHPPARRTASKETWRTKKQAEDDKESYYEGLGFDDDFSVTGHRFSPKSKSESSKSISQSFVQEKKRRSPNSYSKSKTGIKLGTWLILGLLAGGSLLCLLCWLISQIQ
jgi:hypothetical protein